MKNIVLTAFAVLSIALGGMGITAPAHALASNTSQGSANGGSGDGSAS